MVAAAAGRVVRFGDHFAFGIGRSKTPPSEILGIDVEAMTAAALQ